MLVGMRKNYATDLSDKEWAYLCRHLPEMPKDVKMRVHALRDILDAIFYVLKSGCPWRLMPGDFPPWQTGFLPLPPVPAEWDVASYLQNLARRRASKDGPSPGRLGGYLGCSEREDG